MSLLQWFEGVNGQQTGYANYFTAHAAYLEGRYADALAKSLSLLDKNSPESADKAQVLDLVLRSALKVGSVEDIVVSLARDALNMVTFSFFPRFYSFRFD